MPTSALEVAPAVLHYLWEVRPPDRPIRVLDIGPGWGKYAVLVREYVDAAAELRAVEAWQPYIDHHRLRALYDEVLAADILGALDGHQVLRRWLTWPDAVLMVDVIEHLDRDRALALLDLIACPVVISTPARGFDPRAADPGLPPTEAHVSIWTPEDFGSLRRLYGYHHRLYDEIGAIVCRLEARPS
jgi:hypothetical protein